MNKTLNVIKKIVVWLIVLLAIAMMIFTLVTMLTCNQTERDLLGYRGFIVRSDSMSATDFNAGDLVVVKEVDPATLQEGDIISFTSPNPENYGEVVTHKIRKLTTDDNGNPGFITYGTTTDTDDEDIVTYELILGKYVKAFPSIGKFFAFLKTTPGYIVCIFLPFLLLILIQGVNSVKLFKQYKREQMEEMQAIQQKQKDEMEEERKRLEEERLQSQKMMAELLELKKQMGEMKNTDAAAPQNQSAPEHTVSEPSEEKKESQQTPTEEEIPKASD